MRFGILGPLQVWADDGSPVGVAGPRPRALLTLLLWHAGRPVGLPQIVDAQYGGDAPDGAVNAVQAQVSRLRRALPSGTITHEPAGYRAAVDPDDVDVHRFTRLARQGAGRLTAGDPDEAAGTLRRALGLWRGPALADLPHAHAEAARLEEQRLAVTEDLIEAELALPSGTSVDRLRELTAAHPSRERLSGQLMRALHAAGRRAEALDEFTRIRELLADRLGVDPSAELAELHRDLLRDNDSARPAPRGIAASLTGFVGRETELARLGEWRDRRLVTIVGPGGIGKTRLAMESARPRRTGTCFVDLSGVEESDQVPHTVLSALGLRDTGFRLSAATDPVERLVAALRDRRILLIVDNCEHLIDASASVVRSILDGCPDVSVLATSREPLGLTGENVVTLAPLPSADRHGAAARLFAERARAARPDFTLDESTVDDVLRICAAVDGLPLALELAAARIRQFGVDRLADRLTGSDPFRLLNRGDRTARARHRTLRAAVEWSWDLLGPRERRFARRFAVFAAGATAEAVGPVTDMDDVEDLLADLVDKSLITVESGRYRMLETIRLYCAERLETDDDADTVRRKHSGYYLSLALRADPHLRRAGQLDWLRRLSDEHANLMAALHWSRRHDPATGARLVAALAGYWWLSGRRAEAGEAAADLVETVPPELDEEYVACVVHAVPRPAAAHWERAERLVWRRDHPLRYPFGIALWGMTAGPSAPARDGTLPPDTSPSDDPWLSALERLSFGILAILDGRPGDAGRILSAVRDEFTALGDRWGIAQALDWLAELASRSRDSARAQQLWADALSKCEELGAHDEAVDIWCRRAADLLRDNDIEAAEAGYRRAAELHARAGHPDVPPTVQLGLGRVAQARGEPGTAAARFRDVLADTDPDSFGQDMLRPAAWAGLARLASAAGDVGEAARRYAAAWTALGAAPLREVLADAVEAQSEAALLADNPERAARLLGAAETLRGGPAIDPEATRCVADTTARLGPSRFGTAYAAGRGLTESEVKAMIDGESA